MAQILQKVALNNVRFFAYHGFYPEEQVVGNVFILDIETEFPVQESLEDDLTHTVNYERLFEIADTQMKQTRKLLETVVQGMLQQIKADFPFVNTIRICLRKMNPPLAGEVGSSMVELNYKR